MDKQLKERLIGALVIVLVAIIIVPVVLDGPDEASRTETLPLPEAGTTEPAAGTQSWHYDLENGDSESGPENREPPPMLTGMENTGQTADPDTATATEEATTAPPQSAQQTVTRSEPPAGEAQTASAPAPEAAGPAREPAVADTAPAGAWAVQVGSFSEAARAESYAAELRKKGFRVFTMEFTTGGTTYHRVRVGPQATRAEAEKAAERLKAATGGPAKVVSNTD